MSFTIENWKEEVRLEVDRFAADPKGVLQNIGTISAYGFLVGCTILPIITSFAVDPLTTREALVSLLGGVGANLIANIVQHRYDAASTMEVVELEAKLPEYVRLHDALAKATNVFPIAIQALEAADNFEAADQVKSELKQLGKLEQYLATPPTVHQNGMQNIAHTVNHGHTVTVSGGTTYIANNQVIKNTNYESPDIQHEQNIDS